MPRPKFNVQTLSTIGCSVFLGFVAIKFVADSFERGVLPRKANIKLSMAANWLDNESRTCLSGYAFDYKRQVYAADTMACPADAFAESQHDLPVTFYGKLERAEVHDFVRSNGNLIGDSDWRCVKHSDAFTCYAID